MKTLKHRKRQQKLWKTLVHSDYLDYYCENGHLTKRTLKKKITAKIIWSTKNTECRNNSEQQSSAG